MQHEEDWPAAFIDVMDDIAGLFEEPASERKQFVVNLCRPHGRT
jgi:hypothetical protein